MTRHTVPDLNIRQRVSTTNHEPLRKEVNATIANSLLNTVFPTTFQVGTVEWVNKAIFPDEFLPVPFNDECLDDVEECWDKSTQKFSNFPQLGEHAVQNWLNHLAHTLGVKHGLIKPEEKPAEVLSADEDEVDSSMEERGFVIADVYVYHDSVLV